MSCFYDIYRCNQHLIIIVRCIGIIIDDPAKSRSNLTILGASAKELKYLAPRHTEILRFMTETWLCRNKMPAREEKTSNLMRKLLTKPQSYHLSHDWILDP